MLAIVAEGIIVKVFFVMVIVKMVFIEEALVVGCGSASNGDDGESCGC